MSKRKDSPIFRMVVEPGALVPADAYTEERLDTYRHHTIVNVRMTQDIDPPLMRKYWSVLSLAVKQCRTPWRTSDEASDAIKRAFGVVRKQRSASGAEVEEVGSLTDLEGPAFEDFFEGAMALLYRITGVDPETLWKETPDPGIDSPDATHSPVPDPLVPTGDTGDDGDHGAVEQAAAAGLSESLTAAATDRQGGGDGSFEAPPQSPPKPPPSSGIVMRHENIQSSSDGVPPDGGGDGSGGPEPPSTPSLSSATLEVDAQIEADRAVERPTSERQAATSGPEEGRRDSRESTGTLVVKDADLVEVSLVPGGVGVGMRGMVERTDERAMVNSADPMSTRELKQEAIKKILDLALDPDINDFDRDENLKKARAWWIAKMPGHPKFVKEVFDTAGKVMRKELPRPAAQNFLFGLRDG